MMLLKPGAPIRLKFSQVDDCNSIGILGAFHVSNLIAGKIQTHQASAPRVCACRKHRRGDFYIGDPDLVGIVGIE